MKDWIRVEDEIMHVGADWNRLYSVDESIDLTDATAVCKIRDLKDDVFIQKDSKSWKLVMGEIEIIHDISMH